MLLGGAASLVAASVPAKVFAQAKPHRIDVHHHIAPPSWLDAMDVIGRKDFPLANWSVQKTIEDMDKGGVEIATLGPGSVVGEGAIVNRTLRSATVVALTPLKVVHFTRDTIEDLVEQVPSFGTALRAAAAGRLEEG